MKRILVLYAVMGIIVWATYAIVVPVVEIRGATGESGTELNIQRVRMLGSFVQGGFGIRYYNRLVYKNGLPEEESAGIHYGLTFSKEVIGRNTVKVWTEKLEDGSRKIMTVQLNGKEIPAGPLRDWAMSESNEALREGRQRLGVN